MEYNTVLKRKKILTHAILWRSPGDIILSKVNQLHDHTCCLIPVTLSTLCSQTDGDTKEHGGRGWGSGEGRCCLMITEFQFCKMKRVVRRACFM